MKILLTGASSFTGCHFAKHLALSGCEVIAALRSETPAHTVVAKRLVVLHQTKGIRIANYEGFETDSMLELIRSVKPDVLINHGAYMKNYRNEDFNLRKSLEVNAFPVFRVLSEFRECGGRLCVHSGTVFEPRASRGDGAEHAMSVYGLSKSLVYEMLRFAAYATNIPLFKFVIPNPVGPMENPDRLIPTFYQKWTRHETPILKDANLVRDHVPVTWLARVLAKRIAELVSKSESRFSETEYHPSGIVENQEAFLSRVSQAFRSRTKLDCRFTTEALAKQFVQRVNWEPVLSELGLDREAALEEFWNETVAYYRSL